MDIKQLHAGVSLDMKVLVGALGAIATITVAAITWSISSSERISNNETNIIHLKEEVNELEDGIKDISRQNIEIDRKLTDILVKQDKRIELIEYRMEQEIKKG